MEENEVKKFELNTKVLENFDEIMSTKLDEIEELKITGLDQGSKLLNIISLCANVKTLIIEGDPRLNATRVLTNIFKPEALESLVLDNVKMPTADSLKRYSNLREITLKNIRVCPIKEFLGGLQNPEKLEHIWISDTDMLNQSITILEKFANLKSLKLERVQNIKLEKLQFLKDNKNLENLEILANQVAVTELNHLLQSKCSKCIEVAVTDSVGKAMEKCMLKIEENVVEMSVLVDFLPEIAKQVRLTKINRLNVIFQEKPQNAYYIKILKKIKCDIHILLNDFSCLNVAQAVKLRDMLGIETIEFVDKKKTTEFDIEDYMNIRKEIENTIQKIGEEVSEPEKFLQIYQYLGKEFQISEEEPDITKRICTTFQLCQLLQNCLKCVGIHSNMITGQDLEKNGKHYWNQVELEGKWYHVDLGLDIENVKKNKPEFCLLGDKDFLETHTPKSGKNNYCAENFNPKLINVFFKTGLFRDKLLTSYIEVIVEKIKKLFQWNKKQEVLALSEPESDTNEEDK